MSHPPQNGELGQPRYGEFLWRCWEAAIHTYPQEVGRVLDLFANYRFAAINAELGMPMSREPEATHGVQLFVLIEGKIAQGRYVECRDGAEACKVAEEKVRLGRSVGAAAFARAALDADIEHASEPITLAIFGTVPPGMVDHLPF